MGDEISRREFSLEDAREFESRLREETRILTEWFDDDYFETEKMKCGFELEACLLTDDFSPAPVNEDFLKKVDNPLVVPELSKFNFEINSTPHPLEGNILSKLEEELFRVWRICEIRAEEIGSKLLTIGILPTLCDEVLTIDNMSSLNRYSALNQQVLRLRGGRPLELKIEGRDFLHVQHQDVMLESAATSLQIHCQVTSDEAARHYNLSQILSAPMVAAAANSPYLFCRDLWDETRIPVFEQSVSVASFVDDLDQVVRRVTFGTGYATDSLLKPFLENLECYPVLLPLVLDDDPSWLSHLRLQNGTVWRWTRPLIGLNEEGKPHLRIEHRVPSAGPSIPDVIANIALLLGLTTYYAGRERPLECEIPFEIAKENFYAAAKRGLQAQIKWEGGATCLIGTLLEDVLLPSAQEGLQSVGLAQEEIDYYLGEVMALRLKSRQNGAAWQRAYIANHGSDFQGMTGAYYENQKRNLPVHQWAV